MLRTANIPTNVEAEKHAQPHEGISILLILYFVIYLFGQKCRCVFVVQIISFFKLYSCTHTYIYNGIYFTKWQSDSTFII